MFLCFLVFPTVSVCCGVVWIDVKCCGVFLSVAECFFVFLSVSMFFLSVA